MKEESLPPACLSAKGFYALSHERGFVKSAREQYEEADARRACRVLLKRWARFGAFALDEVKKENAELAEKGPRALSFYETDPHGYERQVLFALQIGLFYLCFPKDREGEGEMIERLEDANG